MGVVFAFGVACLMTLRPVVGTIYKMTEAEYDRLPPLFQLDEYDRCLRTRGGQYCHITAQLYGENDLYKTIQEYSAATKIHYNHTLIHWGVCAQASCGEYLKNSTNITIAIEACLNATMTRDYQLTTRVVRSLCTKSSETLELDVTDYAYVAIVLVLLGLNGLGSLYDFCGTEAPKSFGRKLLHCFSLKRNWNQLVAPNSNVRDPMMRRLKCLSFFRTIFTCVVVLAHSPLGMLISSMNPNYIESTYHHLPFLALYCASVIVQTFFLISGFLMAYNMLTSGRKHWWMLPKRVLLRWLRLTPAYAMVLFFAMTWARHISDGPLFKVAMMSESNDCRTYWWRHLLYIQNYFPQTTCMGHDWYLAADMQLSVLGLVIFCVWSSARVRKIAVAVTFVVGLLTPAATMVLHDLPAILVVSPEVAANVFVSDPSFNFLYKPGHTNIVCYAIGMGLAFLVYNLQDCDIGAQKYKKFRLLYVILIPLEGLTIMSGSVFYMDDVVVPKAVSAVYCSAIKPVFGTLIALHIFFTIVKVDKAMRAIINWGGWAVLARLTYCVYIVHVTLIRTGVVANHALTRMCIYLVTLNYISILVASFLLAAVMNLLVEAPAGHVVKLCLDSKKTEEKPIEKPISVVTNLTESKETVEIKL